MGMTLFLNRIYVVSKLHYLCLLHVNCVSVGKSDLCDIHNRDASLIGINVQMLSITNCLIFLRITSAVASN